MVTDILNTYELGALDIRENWKRVDYTLELISEGIIILNPNYQVGPIWGSEEKSMLIESMLMRIPLPIFGLAENAEGNRVVVNGFKRLNTIKQFLSNEFPLDLKNRPEIDKKRFQDLELRYQRRLKDCSFNFFVISNRIPEHIKLDIIDRFNRM